MISQPEHLFNYVMYVEIKTIYIHEIYLPFLHLSDVRHSSIKESLNIPSQNNIDFLGGKLLKI